MKEIVGFALLLVGIVLVTALILVTAMVLLSALSAIPEYYRCQELAEMHPDHEFHWSFWTACRVRVPSGLWLAEQDLQYIEGEFQPRGGR